ncbi:MAG: hypothetical protein ACI9VS_003220 [Candidatus Binatia bacterium]
MNGPAGRVPSMSEKTDQMKFRSFRGTWASREELFRQAAHFAGDIGREWFQFHTAPIVRMAW